MWRTEDPQYHIYCSLSCSPTGAHEWHFGSGVRVGCSTHPARIFFQTSYSCSVARCVLSALTWVRTSPSSSLLVSYIKPRSILPSTSSVPSLPKMLMQVSSYSVLCISPLCWSHFLVWELQISTKENFLIFLCTHSCFAAQFALTYKGQNGGSKRKEPAAFYLKANRTLPFPYPFIFNKVDSSFCNVTGKTATAASLCSGPWLPTTVSQS